jgi:hypothetical protein
MVVPLSAQRSPQRTIAIVISTCDGGYIVVATSCSGFGFALPENPARIMIDHLVQLLYGCHALGLSIAGLHCTCMTYRRLDQAVAS